jgi:hypothetical protein
MKKLYVIILALLLIPSVFALNLQIEKQSSNEVLIPELNKPVIFDLNIKNLGASDTIEFYNLLGFQMFPVGTTKINSGETKNIQLELLPLKEIKERGFYTFQYFIKGTSSEQQEELTFKIIDLEDAFDVGSGDIEPESNSINIYIKNRENFDFGKINARFSSAFFNFDKEFEMGPRERKDFAVELNKDDFKKLMAGFYTLKADITAGDSEANVEGIIEFVEKDIIKTTKKDYGFVINTKVIEKINEGNVAAESETIIKKNIFSRLFTSMSPEPDIVERSGLNVYYTWNREINPGENLEITIRTNWLFPLLIIALIVIIVVMVKIYVREDLRLRKRVSFVRTKGGEFALKVSVFVQAKKYLERINIIDRLPALVKLHEKFGGEQPSRVNEKTRRIEWNFEKLEAGEMRMISYIIYSKVGVLGKFALPSATAIYEKEGEIKETDSNKAFFVAEQKPDREEI